MRTDALREAYRDSGGQRFEQPRAFALIKALEGPRRIFRMQFNKAA